MKIHAGVTTPQEIKGGTTIYFNVNEWEDSDYVFEHWPEGTNWPTILYEVALSLEEVGYHGIIDKLTELGVFD